MTRAFSLAPLVAVALVGCSSNTNPQLVAMSDIEPGETCPSGGTLVQTGLDDDGDGVLQEAEVSSSTALCTASTTLIATETLAVDSELCPWGGALVSSGLDDGLPSGSANDGVLQPGEVDQSEALCNQAPAGADLAPRIPDAVSGQPSYSINLSGGNGSSGFGGAGGVFTLGYADSLGIGIGEDLPFSGLPGGAVVLASTGQATAPAARAMPALNLGSNPLVISSNSTLTQLQLEERTGLHIASGVEVTLSGTTVASNVILNEGSIVAPGDVDIVAVNYVGTPGSSVTAGGDLTLSTFTQTYNAGALTARYPDGSGARVDVITESESTALLSGHVVNLGTIDVSGNAGRSGGRVTLYSLVGSVYNGGAIDASGGDQPGGQGGDAGRVLLASELAGITNTGSITASGGAGSTGGHARGSEQPPEDVDDATIALVAAGPDLINTGSLIAAGGAGSAGPGGRGGSVMLYGLSGEGVRAAGDLHHSGDVDLHGGSGTNGGSGGAFVAGLYTERSEDASIQVLGVTAVDASGGAGVVQGGSGGQVHLGNGCPESPSAPGGGVVLASAVNVDAGSATTGTGGDGGSVFASACLGEGARSNLDNSGVILAGDFSAHGGNGDDGGSGGGLFLIADRFIESTASFAATGGDGVTSGGDGCEAAYLYALNGSIYNTGSIDCSAGNASAPNGTGGDASEGVQVLANNVHQDGALFADGGNGGTTGRGGHGGLLALQSWNGVSVAPTNWSAQAGSGDSVGQPGALLVDGLVTFDAP